jgi:hypothetical protein
MYLTAFLYSSLLFFILTPKVLVRIPTMGSPLSVAITHGLIFAIVLYFTYRPMWVFSEGFQVVSPAPPPPPVAPAGAPPPRPPPTLPKCNKDSECANGNVCNTNSASPPVKECIPRNSLPTGSFCNRSGVCVNGCKIDARICL